MSELKKESATQTGKKPIPEIVQEHKSRVSSFKEAKPGNLYIIDEEDEAGKGKDVPEQPERGRSSRR